MSRANITTYFHKENAGTTMDETRKRIVLTGAVIGAVVVGGVMLARLVPREKRGETLNRIGKDTLKFLKWRFGANVAFHLVEQMLDRGTKPTDAELSA
ncbi:MAG: hypothetical protein OHK0029_30910 [Armatimonadaceae bacterium]